MPLRQISKITKLGLFTIEVRTPNTLSHSIVSDNPDMWERISDFIKNEMNSIIVKPNELDR